VPERVFVAGANGESGGANQGMLGMLINLLVAEKSGFQFSNGEGVADLKEFAERMTRDAMASVQQASMTPPVTLAAEPALTPAAEAKPPE
jgi:hypothetical protein